MNESSKKYDYVIVGCGLYGALFAFKAKNEGKKCLIIDKRPHIGGNIYTERTKEGVDLHEYGPHILHTSNPKVWNFVNSITPFNNFINQPIARYHDEVYNLPFNMNTFCRLWGTSTPEEAQRMIENQRYKGEVTNLEEQALSLVGKDVYQKLIKEYTEKQWGRDCKELPSFIIKRLPLRFTYNNNYFNDTYQGIPIEGYTKFIEKLIEGVEVLLETDYFSNREYFDGLCDTLVYCGKLDEFYEYQFGKLEYRSLKFVHIRKDKVNNYQGNAIVNYTDNEHPYTRIIEHKHFTEVECEGTYITYEYPQSYDGENEAYYPINNKKNEELYQRYKKLADNESNVIFGGRLAEYKYYDMDKIIEKFID